MNRPIDTLFYQWATTDDDKRIPTIFEDITELEDADKIDVLMTEYAHLVAGLIESEIIVRSIIEEKLQQVQENQDLDDADDDLIAQAIVEHEDVADAQQLVEECKNALNLLHTSMVRVFSREV